MQANADTLLVKPDQQSSPLFYQKPLLLRSGPNARSGLTAGKGYEFARRAVAVPIGFSEFPRAARHYPIAFAAKDLAPVAVLAVTPGTNLFIEPDGSWRAGHYVPAYVRRYPFNLRASSDCTEPMLVVDTASERFVWDVDRVEGASRFFGDGGRPTATSRVAMLFCQAYRDDCERTKAFTEALQEADLLVQRPNPARQPDEPGFLSIDDQVFRRLTELSVTRWQRDSWLLLMALAVTSARNWKALTDLHRRLTEQGEPV